MPSDSAAWFVELARANRLLPPDVIDDLARRPDLPQSDLPALCDYLVEHKVLTEYQAGRIRGGKSDELTVGGFPVLGEIGSGPGGTAYRAVHPVRRTAVVVRRLNPDWFAPFDNPAAYLGRARTAGAVHHPHLLPLLDAGVDRDDPFVAVEGFDGADLRTLVEDIGPMPAALAAEFARQAARGLEAAHAARVTHGDVRPEHLLVGPLVKGTKKKADGSPRYRPAATAVVRVSELGLVPQRAKANDWPDEWAFAAEFLPPERREAAAFTPAGDVYMLGAVLYFLLTGQTPGYAPLPVARPDCPPELVSTMVAMMANDPAARPTMAAAAERLEAVVQAGRRAAAEPPLNDSSVPLGRDAAMAEAPLAEALFASGGSAEKLTPGWAGHPAVGGVSTAEAIDAPGWSPQDPPSNDSMEPPPPPLRAVRARRGLSRTTLWLLVGLFVLLNALAVAIWFFVLSK